MTTAERDLHLEEHDGGWRLAGPAASHFGLANDYLAYLSDRHYSPRTVRAYGFDLLALCRWLHSQGQTLEAVTTDMLLAWLAACRQARLPGRPGPNVVSIGGGRLDGYAATTINHRLAAITGLYGFRSMRDPAALNPVPKGRETRWVHSAQRNGLLGHLARPNAAFAKSGR
jgi:integrase/recombinase XerD